MRAAPRLGRCAWCPPRARTGLVRGELFAALLPHRRPVFNRMHACAACHVDEGRALRIAPSEFGVDLLVPLISERTEEKAEFAEARFGRKTLSDASEQLRCFQIGLPG